MAIEKFFGPYQFMSNFWPSQVELDGIQYPTVEHAYQAAKTLNPIERDKVRAAASAGVAKKLGRKVTIRDDWDKVKLSVMADLVTQKFQDPTLKAKLLATGTEELIEGNWWGDTYWGVCQGKGENHLGQILMNIRGALSQS